MLGSHLAQLFSKHLESSPATQCGGGGGGGGGGRGGGGGAEGDIATPGGSGGNVGGGDGGAGHSGAKHEYLSAASIGRGNGWYPSVHVAAPKFEVQRFIPMLGSHLWQPSMHLESSPVTQSGGGGGDGGGDGGGGARGGAGGNAGRPKHCGAKHEYR